MSSITNINNNSSLVNVGRTTPVAPGQQPASKSIPVVLAADQSPVPVVEQNKVQSEVALSLLGIPRAEVALGIFADVNTYDVNPTEWSSSPQYYLQGYGIKHLPNEAGALVEAPRNSVAVLTSKRFFRYQPGRVSAATFGIKSSISVADFARSPITRKYGIYDKFDGYYWETRQSGKGDNFSVVRRTQSLLKSPTAPYGVSGAPLRGAAPAGATLDYTQLDDYRIVGKAPNSPLVSPNNLPKDRGIVLANKFSAVEAAYDAVIASYGSTFYADLATAINNAGGSTDAATVEAKCKRDADYWLDFILDDLEWGGDAHIRVNTTNFDVAYLADTNTFEVPVYQQLKTILTGLTGLSSAAVTKLGQLVDLIIAKFSTSQTDPSVADGSINYGSKPKLDTIYDVKKQYWAYVVATKKENGDPVTYDDSLIPSGVTTEEIKYKCQRDVVYLIDGYKNDIAGGGNAETKYNMSMYLKGSGMSIYTQLESNGTPTEVERHTHLKSLINDDLQNKFGYSASSSVVTKQADLAQKVIENFTVENTDSMVTGNRGFAGNLVALRDGLVMLHAGVFDPALLKDKENILAQADASLNSFRLSKGIVTFGQRVRLKTEINSDLQAGAIYKVAKVIGSKGSEFTLQKEDGTILTFTSGEVENIDIYFETVVPFILPTDYDPAVYIPAINSAVGDFAEENDLFPRGLLFPYKYANGGDLSSDSEDKFVGFINTARSTQDETDGQYSERQRVEIDAVNFVPEYLNWIKNNVKPEYYGVYEYRIPRSRFSHDKLDGLVGENATPLVYSDRSTGPNGVAVPGQQVLDENGLQQTSESEYDFDFTKVSMLKIEFSWYGAVGALFLAYVPVGNGEARWVRVHHLRASNQLKIASLGNATLPITYNVFGGGDSLSFGDGEETGGTAETTGADQGYGNDSHQLVKYGASYYIDGGDRGTVRLYSHNNDDAKRAYGKQFAFASGDYSATPIPTIDTGSINPTFFIGAKVQSSSPLDQNVRVIWADPASGTVELSQPLQSTSGITITADRAATVFGLETKQNILSTVEGNSVRNRVQVYPTKLSTSNLGDNPVRLRMKKTPLFQGDTAVSGSFVTTEDYDITSENLPLPTNSDNYLQNDESVYGWFKAQVGVDLVTVFGRLYKEAGEFYFELLESYSGTVTLIAGTFLVERRFAVDGTIITTDSKVSAEKEGLSSVLISENTQVPIPGTGINIATLYLQEGTEQIDLAAYFDYNKEYLSFPLTDIADTLYFAVDSDTSSSTYDLVSLGITWEEQ